MVAVTKMVVSHTNRTNMINGIGQNIKIRSIPFLSHERIPENLFSLVLNGKRCTFILHTQLALVPMLSL